MNAPLIISASGIRGIVGQSMTPQLAARYGSALGAWAGRAAGGRGCVLVGRDSRTSGPALCDAASAGLRAAGCDVKSAGLTPTPSLLLAVKEDDEALAGLLVTASHNPVEWNGLKLVGPAGRFLTPEEAEAVQALAERDAPMADGAKMGVQSRVSGVIDRHVECILDLSLIDRAAVSGRRPRVALDCVHGAGGAIMPPLLERLGCEVVGMGLETDGRFPRNPEPTAANLEGLGCLVRDSQADIGLAVDPDVDRLALVDETGLAIGEDWTLALAVEYVLSIRPGPVVTNLSSSQSIEDAAAQAGVPLYRTPVGEIRVAMRMLEVGAVIGGEGNGGVMLPDLNPTRDAPLAAALVLSWLARQDRPLSALLAERQSYVMERRKLRRPDAELARLYDILEAGAKSGAVADRADGLRLTWRDTAEWIHVRPSGTEPIVRIYAEAPEAAAADALADWAEEQLARLM